MKVFAFDKDGGIILLIFNLLWPGSMHGRVSYYQQASVHYHCYITKKTRKSAGFLAACLICAGYFC